MNQSLTCKIDENGLAVIVFDCPDKKVNVLNIKSMTALDEVLDSLAQNTQVKAVIIVSAKPNVFIAGGDLDEIKDIDSEEEGREKSARGQMIVNKIENLKVPVIAAIDGTCLGGGLEVALACHFRIASDNPHTQLGLPEVNLGFIPGLGATQRLPRLIGLQKALQMILTAQNVDTKRAIRMGLVDKVAPQPIILDEAKKFALEVLTKEASDKILKKRKKGGILNLILEKTPIGQAIVFNQAKKMVLKRTRGYYPAPLVAIDVVKKGLKLPLEKGLKLEPEAFGKLAITSVSKNLVSLFFMQEELKRFSGIKDKKIEPLPISKMGIIGTGTMGTGIAELGIYHDIPTRVKCINYDVMAEAYKGVRKIFDAVVKRRRMSPKEADDKMRLLSMTDDYKGFGRVDVCIEAAFEDLELKKQLIKEFNQVNTHGIFATNTSSLSISEIASVSTHPDKVIGMHFFNPAYKMPLVEVVRGNATSDETVVTIVALAKKLGKTPLVVKETPGFLVNRILVPYLNEAVFLLEEGVGISDVDKAMLNFGMPMGPLELLDEVGIDVADVVARVIFKAFGMRITPSTIIQKMKDKKRLGKKAKIGFYNYHKKKKIPQDAWIKEITNASPKKLSTQILQERMVYLMINEAGRCLEEGIVLNPTHVDMGMILGTGFPPFRGGLLKYADEVGIKHIVEKLEELEKSIGIRFSPARLLKEMCDKDKGFYNHSGCNEGKKGK